jgi:hypothetical protein
MHKAHAPIPSSVFSRRTAAFFTARLRPTSVRCFFFFLMEPHHQFVKLRQTLCVHYREREPGKQLYNGC